MIILGIESSCDETGIAIVKNGREVLASGLASSMDIHASYGGVIPEIAARSHIEAIIPLLDNVLEEYRTKYETSDPWQEIDGIAVTYGAGLSGSLLVGTLTARTLAILNNKPLYPVNHVEAHVYANFLGEKQLKFPLLALIVSGGHSQLVYFRNHFDYSLLGQTVDDAVGEAFDKVARICGLPYPGGPNIAKAAQSGDPKAVELPKARVEGPYNFSFSGLKTAVLRASQALVGADYRLESTKLPERLSEPQKADIAASFQSVAMETLVEKTLKAFNEYSPKTVVIAGGVAANQELRRQLSEALPIEVNYVSPSLCTDNGEMIAALGCFMAEQGNLDISPYELQINPNLKM